mmetsp:Transcript_37008/g.98592  ORF Transcript_37008/g.98592 Transcript_37008/m.98592 type:complete len:246 (+) Transcript_37008:255-992(+)
MPKPTTVAPAAAREAGDAAFPFGLAFGFAAGDALAREGDAAFGLADADNGMPLALATATREPGREDGREEGRGLSDAGFGLAAVCNGALARESTPEQRKHTMAPEAMANFPPTEQPHEEQRAQSAWKLPKLHFKERPVMTSPHATHASPCCAPKQAVQKGFPACTLYAPPASGVAHCLHWKQSACNLPPSRGMSTTLPPLILCLHREHAPRDHCVVAAWVACACSRGSIFTGPARSRALMNMASS